MEPTTALDLTMNVGEIFGYVNQFFGAVWPLLAVGLAVVFAPKVIQMIKSSVG